MYGSLVYSLRTYCLSFCLEKIMYFIVASLYGFHSINNQLLLNFVKTIFGH